jgi:hypothetical protein
VFWLGWGFEIRESESREYRPTAGRSLGGTTFLTTLAEVDVDDTDRLEGLDDAISRSSTS